MLFYFNSLIARTFMLILIFIFVFDAIPLIVLLDFFLPI